MRIATTAYQQSEDNYIYTVVLTLYCFSQKGSDFPLPTELNLGCGKDAHNGEQQLL